MPTHDQREDVVCFGDDVRVAHEHVRRVAREECVGELRAGERQDRAPVHAASLVLDTELAAHIEERRLGVLRVAVEAAVVRRRREVQPRAYDVVGKRIGRCHALASMVMVTA